MLINVLSVVLIGVLVLLSSDIVRFVMLMNMSSGIMCSVRLMSVCGSWCSSVVCWCVWLWFCVDEGVLIVLV